MGVGFCSARLLALPPTFLFFFFLLATCGAIVRHSVARCRHRRRATPTLGVDDALFAHAPPSDRGGQEGVSNNRISGAVVRAGSDGDAEFSIVDRRVAVGTIVADGNDSDTPAIARRCAPPVATVFKVCGQRGAAGGRLPSHCRAHAAPACTPCGVHPPARASV